MGTTTALSDRLPVNDTAKSDLNAVTPFRPVQVLQKYMGQHSQERLAAEFESSNAEWLLTNRKFSVANYWCPHRAGNILHSFFNTLIWSMIHNRTVLWIYHNTSNQEEDCETVLQRAPCLPSYLEWQPRLGLETPVPVSNSVTGWPKSLEYSVVLYPQIPDVLAHGKSITRNAWSDHPLKTEGYRTYIQQLPDEFQNNTADLYSKGVNFLFGMLYEDLFQLQRPIAFTVVRGTDTDSNQPAYGGSGRWILCSSRNAMFETIFQGP
jgi:hypothetical protein